eukprot:6376156-Amphidinium_carterae.1
MSGQRTYTSEPGSTPDLPWGCNRMAVPQRSQEGEGKRSNLQQPAPATMIQALHTGQQVPPTTCSSSQQIWIGRLTRLDSIIGNTASRMLRKVNIRDMMSSMWSSCSRPRAMQSLASSAKKH